MKNLENTYQPSHRHRWAVVRGVGVSFLVFPGQVDVSTTTTVATYLYRFPAALFSFCGVVVKYLIPTAPQKEKE